MKFYPRDWRGDQALRAVSLSARGLWIECLCIMHEAKPYGHLLLNGTPVGDDALARMTGVPVDEVSALVAELRQAGVLSMTGKGVVFSRRMTKDHARAQKGRKAANKRWLQVSDDVEQSDEPNRIPITGPITQKPETREKKEYTPPAQRLEPAAPRTEFDGLLEKLLAANGIADFRAERGLGLNVLAPVLAWVAGGLDLELDVLAGIRSKPKPDARTWGYFEGQVYEFAKKRRGATAIAVAKPTASTVDWAAAVMFFKQDGSWVHGWGPKPGEAGCRVPPEFLRELAA
jgi:hypothetical protein